MSEVNKLRMKKTKSLFGILTTAMRHLAPICACLFLSVVCLCLISACGHNGVTDSATGTGNSRENARQDAKTQLDRLYKSYDVVDENTEQTGSHFVHDESKRYTSGTTDYEVQTWRCIIRVKNAVPAQTTTKAQTPTPAQAAPPVQEVKAAESPAVTPGKDNEIISQKVIRAIGLFSNAGHLLPPQGTKSPKDSVEFALLYVGIPDFLQIGAECDLRIVDISQDTNRKLPIAYILFNKDEFGKGVKVTEKTMTENFLPLLKSANEESLRTDLEQSPSLGLNVFGRELEFKDCSVVGLALLSDQFNDYLPEENQGLGGIALATREKIEFVLIEPGTSFHKSIMSASYYTNIFAAASTRETEIVKPFVGTWKNKTGNYNIESLEIGPNHTFQCAHKDIYTGDPTNTAGNYWVFPDSRKPIFNKIVFLKDGKAWIEGSIDSEDGTLGIGGNQEGPRGQLEKVQ